jgi:hypothetical protein
MPREKNPISATPRKPAPRRKSPARKAQSTARFVDPEQRTALIAQAAYFRAERRGFAPGHETEDWLAAEAEVDARLLQSAPDPGAQPAS